MPIVDYVKNGVNAILYVTKLVGCRVKLLTQSKHTTVKKF